MRRGQGHGAPRSAPVRPTARPGQRGFTLVELMVVIALIALAGQIILMNLGAMVPSTVLDSEAQRLVSTIEFLRAEAQLQGKSYRLELDLDNDRFRIVMPPEERLVSEQTIEDSVPMSWQPLDEAVDLAGYALVGQPTIQARRVEIVIDHHGFTADQVIILRMKSEDLRDMVWSIQLRGLDRRARVVRRQDGQEALLEKVEEFAF